MTSRVAQASQPPVEGGESQDLSTQQINEIYYDVVGGRTKNSSLYGLGSQAKVVFDRLRTPRGRASSSYSSSEVESLRKENQDLKTQMTTIDQRWEKKWAAQEQALAQM